jgi:hypothetical protein
MRRLLEHLIDLGCRWLARFVELEGFDRAMALAGQTFAALLPLLMGSAPRLPVTARISPRRSWIVST